jgi:hypothetical protein
MAHRKRRKYFVDRDLQSALISKIIRYWIAGLTAVGGLTMLGWLFVWPGIGAFVGPDAIMTSVLPVFVVAVVVSLLIMPFVVIDLIRFSNRFAGPLIRLRRAMHDLAAGKPVEPLRFRKDDLCADIAVAFNRILARIEFAKVHQSDHVQSGGAQSAPLVQVDQENDISAQEDVKVSQGV